MNKLKKKHVYDVFLFCQHQDKCKQNSKKKQCCTIFTNSQVTETHFVHSTFLFVVIIQMKLYMFKVLAEMRMRRTVRFSLYRRVQKHKKKNPLLL